MSIDQRQTFLAGLHVGVVGIPRGNVGSAPLVVPIWYDYVAGGSPWMITDRGSLKGKLLSRAKRISLCVQSEIAPYQYVSVEGPFTVRDCLPGELLAMAIRYLGEDQGRAYAASAGDDGSMVVSLSPETWYSVDYSR